MHYFDGLITLELYHGGMFKSEDHYVGGKIRVEHQFHIDCLTYKELEVFVKSMGYVSSLKYALRDETLSEKYYFFYDEKSLADVLNLHILYRNSLCLKVYIMALTADLTEPDLHGDKENVGGHELSDETDESDTEYVESTDESETSFEWERHDLLSDDEELFEVKNAARNDRERVAEAFLVKSTEELQSMMPKLGGYQSEYDTSDTSCASIDTDEEANFIRRKKHKKCQIYDENCDHKKLKFDIGFRFKDCNECKEGVRLWAIVNGHNIKWKKTGRGKLEAGCEDGCPWKLYASKLQAEPTCVIKSYIGEHRCVRAIRNRQVTSEWLSRIIVPTLKRNPRYGAKDMIKDIRVAYDTIVSPSLCYRAKEKAVDKMRGSYESHYSKLRSYVSYLREMDKAGRFELKTYLDKSEKPVFQRIYIGFSALKVGFMVGCRKVIGFDACFLKTVLGGAILAGVGKDCNNKMYPIAWAVVEKENEETWTWFFNILFQEFNISDGNGWTFMSDKQKVLFSTYDNLKLLSFLILVI